MRGSYKSGQRRVLSGSLYKVVIGVILLVAAALVVTLLAVLPAMEDTMEKERKIVSIESTSGENIGVGSNASLIPVRVTYSDGTFEDIILGNTTFSGLDVTTSGQQNVVLSYGGFEQTVTFNVVDINCHISYRASVGGKIQGEMDQVVVSGEDAATVIAVPETGYRFVKWSDGYPLAKRKDERITKDGVINLAIFEKAAYYVRFYYDDGTVGSEELVTYGEVPTKIPSYGDDPKMTKYGYVFTGWTPNLYVDVDGTPTLVTIDRNMNFYPEYVKKATDYAVTVPLDKLGQSMGRLEILSESYEDVTVEGFFEHDALATITAIPYNSREFAYWLIEDLDGNLIKVPKEGSAAVTVGAGGTQVAFSSTRSGSAVQDYQLSFTPNESVAQVSICAIFAYSNSDITFVNYQSPDNNNVEFTVGGLPFGTPLNHYKAGDVDLTSGLPVPKEPVGMQFEGWYELGDETRSVIDGSETFEQPTTLVAKWKRLQYTLVFSYIDDGDENVVWHTTVVTYQDSFASGTNGGLPLTNPTKAKYDFLGWQDALTGTSVDDRTKLYAEDKHVQNDEFVSQHRLNIIPIWSPKSHTLKVDFDGSGTAKLIVDKGKVDSEGTSLTKTVFVLGECEITEDHTYELVVDAMEGYKLVSAMWYYANDGVPYNYGSGISSTTYAVQETSSNTLYATFTPIRLMVSVQNGTEDYVGLIRYNGAVYSDLATDLYVSYNDSMTVEITSPNPIYYISNVTVNGESIGVGLDRDTKQFSFVLENVKADANVVVTFDAANYFLSVDVGAGGSVRQTDLYAYSREDAYDSSSTHTYGEEVYLRIKGNGGSVRKILTAIRINGVLYDLFTNSHADFTLYSYKINGVDLGIGLLYVDGVYYFNYGVAEYQGTEYVFCQRIDGAEDVVFLRTRPYGDYVYSPVSKSAESYAAIYAFLTAELKLSEKNLYDTSIVRDERITQVDLRVTVRDNYNVVFSFSDIVYSVSGTAVGNGTVSVSNEESAYGGTSVLVAAPDVGYYVSGYYVNDGEFRPVNTAVKGENYRLTLSSIDEDKAVRFVFEDIRYAVAFVNETLSNGDLFIGEKKLNASASFAFNYHDEVNLTVTAQSGKRIASIAVNGVETNVHYNQTSYRFYLPDLTSDVTVRMSTADLENDVAANAYSLHFADSESVVGSARYRSAAYNADNTVLLTANYGYTLSTVLVRDTTNGTEYTPAEDPRGLENFSFVIPAGTFPANANVEVITSSSTKQYVLTTSASENGTISTGSRPAYGDLVSVDVTAYDNCYLYAVYVNGERVSFDSSNWSGLTADPNTGNYTYGLYSYTASSDVSIYAEFRVNSYKISVDSSSVNGVTILSVDDSVTNYATHGSYLHISMTADHGYHVSELYVNGVRVTDLTFKTDDENERTTAVYTYKGAYTAGIYTGITGRTNIKVLYEINRYYFVFNLVNDSANFSTDLNMGTLTSSLTLNGNRYYGIEHGSNFSFDVVPNISNGYYLYSLKIEYTSSLGDNVVTRYNTHSYYVPSNGGTIWFNRFVNDESGDSGVVANIAGITAVFRRNLYDFTMAQIGESNTGSVDVVFTHPNANVNGVYVYDGEQTESKEYLYRGGVFYKKVAGVWTETTIELVNLGDRYAYRDNGGTEYGIKIEHGVRYALSVEPAVGYERISLLLNDTESNGFVSENRYSTNLVGDLDVVATFRILVYDVDFSVSVVDKNLTSTIDNELITNYMNISIRVLSGSVYDEEYQQVLMESEYPILNSYTGKISLFADYGVKLAYGSRISFVMTPKFSTTGYYLYQFYLGSNEIPSLLGDRRVEAIYAGPSGTGYSVINDLSARCSFRIMRYSVSSAVDYTEAITGETVNGLAEESGGTIPWSDTAYLKLTVGQGYALRQIWVTRAGDSSAHAVDLTERDLDDAYDEQIFYAMRNDATNEVRDVLVVKNVKGDVSVRAVFEREGHVFIYKFNNASLVDVETRYNEQNATGFPRETDVNGETKGSEGYGIGWIDSNTLVLRTHYYDELLGILTPKNGYKVTDAVAVIRAVVYNPDLGTYQAVVDNAGEEIVTTLNLVNLGNDKKRFTFHNETSQLAALYVRYDLVVEFNIVIKTYALSTSVTRVSATSKVNETEISIDVKDKNGNEVLVNGDAQLARLLTVDSDVVTMVAEHHGYILYSFSAPEGFMLTELSVNGYSWMDLNVSSIVDERLHLTASFGTVGTARVLTYLLRFDVQDDLVQGRNNSDFTRLSVSMTIAPITYSVKIYINGELRDFATMTDGSGNARNGVSDVERDSLGNLLEGTLIVYSPSSAQHHSSVALEPDLLEGYEVVGLVIKTGADLAVSGPNDANLSNTTFPIPTNLNARATFGLNYNTMPGVNVLTNKKTVYFFYTTDIIHYGVSVDAYAYTLDGTFKTLYASSGFGVDELGRDSDVEGIVPLESRAGSISVTVTTNGIGQTFFSGGEYEYFSTVKVELFARPEDVGEGLAGYRVYAISESVGDKYTEVVNGLRGIAMESSVDSAGVTKYTFTYMINSLGSRSFRIVFKQETKVVVHVPNPFKYAYTSGGVNDYRSYVSLEAYENGAKLVNENDDGTGKVQDTYIYTVLVGNFVSFKYSDTNAQTGQTGVTFCTAYDSVAKKYPPVALEANPVYDSLDERGMKIDKGVGKVIDSPTELYVVNNVYGRVSFTKTTYSATQNANGGSIIFGHYDYTARKYVNDAAEPTSGYVYNGTTTVGKAISITVKPNENYVLSRMLVRQIDYAQSVAYGYVIYRTGSYEWLEYDADFAYSDSNGFIISREYDASGNTVFYITMKGDMELTFEFYRYYELRYGVEYASDYAGISFEGELYVDEGDNVRYTNPHSAVVNADTIRMISIGSNEYAPATTDDKMYVYVQYDSNFILTAPTAPDGYVFVGWYVNGYNTYDSLDIALPDASAVNEAAFYVNEEDTEGMMPRISNYNETRAEASVLLIRAVYVPLIKIAVINELYYHANDHWNSWAPGAIRSEGYIYENSGAPTDTSVSVFPTTDTTTRLSNLNYEALLPDSSDLSSVVTARRAEEPHYDTNYGWNLAKAETTLTSGAAPLNSEVYSTIKVFDMLYRYVNADEYIYDYWTDASLSLELIATPSTVKLIGWQYYNWSTGHYDDITYRYVDKSYGQDMEGNYTTVDNGFSLYELNLAYLFANAVDENGMVIGQAMPYAISNSSANNRTINRPLIIRPKFVKVTRLEITQIAYTQELGSGDAIDNFRATIHPVINEEVENSEYFVSIDASQMSGEFDYGSTVHIDYYNMTVEAKGGKDIGNTVPLNFTYYDGQSIMEMRYRFVGWRLNWYYSYNENDRRADFRYIYYAGQDSTDLLGIKGIDLNLFNAFGDEPPGEAYELEAVFVVQYRHSIYSYNVAGSDESYNQASDLGSEAYKNAPSISVALQSTGYSAEFYDRENSIRTVQIGNDLDIYESESKFIQCLVDVGATYRLNVDADAVLADATNVLNDTSGSRKTCFGYDPTYDHEYCRYEYKNTGNEVMIEPSANQTYYGENITVDNTYNLDLQYYSDAILVFENVMYYSGVTLPAAFARYLTNNTVAKMSIWDVLEEEELDSDYAHGNIYIHSDGKTNADGRIYLKTRLINVPNLFGRFDYSLYGFKSGNGIKAARDITYAVNSAGTTNGNNLFNATHSSFRRYVVIDYDGGGYISGGSQLFGDPAYTGTGGRFSTKNTGNGTESNPYTIYNVTQFRNLGLYFNYNEYTCEGVNFKLNADIKLQDVNSGFTAQPYGNSKAWVPLTAAVNQDYSNQKGDYLGFDGILDGSKPGGGNFCIYGLAADQSNLLDKNATTTNPLADFDYSSIKAYGIFGCINGGQIRNVTIGNAFVNLDTFGNVATGTPEYIGILAGRTYNASFENIRFHEADTSDHTTTKQVGLCTTTDGNGNGSRILLQSSTAMGIGALAGLFYNSTASYCEIDVGTRNGLDICFRGQSAYVGTLIGVADGDGNNELQKGLVKGCALKSTSAGNGIYVNHKTDSLTAGGLIGTARNGVFVSKCQIEGNIHMFLGNVNATTINVGGMIATMYNAELDDCFIVSANSSRFDVDSGINMVAATSATTGEGIADEMSYGKAGGLVGYAEKSKLFGVNGGSLGGVFNFQGPVAGGIVGVARDTLVSGFNVYGPGYSGQRSCILMVLQTMTVIAEYGCIVGAATGSTIIDDCSAEGTAGSEGLATIEKALLYVFQYRSDNGTILNNSTDPGGCRNYVSGSTVVGNRTYAGGVVGYLSGALYNSFTKNVRIISKYKNGSPQSDSNELVWAVSLGGLAGYLDVVQRQSTFFGYGTVAAFGDGNGLGLDGADKYDRYVGKAMSRVQSCYTVGSSLVLNAYIWCDGFQVSTYNTNLGRIGCTIGGIVGSTSTAQKYGSYAINGCYSMNCYFVRNIGAYGLDNGEKNTNGAADKGWEQVSDGLNTGMGFIDDNTDDPVYYPNRAGVNIDGGIFGIVSGLTEDGTKYGGACNYCWCKGNTATTNAWPTMSELTNNRKSTTYQRGLQYQTTGGNDPAASQENSTCLKGPYDRDEELLSSGYYYLTGSEAGAMTEETVYVGGAEVSRANLKVIFAGPVVGAYGAIDGRIYKTDIRTGLPVIAHDMIRNTADNTDGDGDYIQQYFWLKNDTGVAYVKGLINGSEEFSYGYNMWRGTVSEAGLQASYLVRGQTSAIGN